MMVAMRPFLRNRASRQNTNIDFPHGKRRIISRSFFIIFAINFNRLFNLYWVWAILDSLKRSLWRFLRCLLRLPTNVRHNSAIATVLFFSDTRPETSKTNRYPCVPKSTRNVSVNRIRKSAKPQTSDRPCFESQVAPWSWLRCWWTLVATFIKHWRLTFSIPTVDENVYDAIQTSVSGCCVTKYCATRPLTQLTAMRSNDPSN